MSNATVKSPRQSVAGGIGATSDGRVTAQGVGRSWAFLTYVSASLAVTMSLGQYYQEAGGLTYWLLLVPLAILPFTRPSAMLRSALGPALPAVVFAILGCGWQALQGDMTATLQGLLLAWGMVWVCSRAAELRIDDIYVLYALAVAVGLIVWIATDLNQWGMLPGTTAAVGEAVWRVSFFPNVAYTGFFSLLVVMIAARDSRPRTNFRKIVVGLAIYFLIFSFVRTAIVGFLAFSVLGMLFRRDKSAAQLFWVSIGVALVINLAIAYSPMLFAALQDNPIISRLFLRGEAELTRYEIWQQLYRPYIWQQHIHQFLTSPWLMGWGSVDFNELKTVDLVAGLDQSGDISLPTRLAAQYGVFGLFIVIWLIQRLSNCARRRDAWGCATFPVVVLAMAHWGTMFHPTDAMFGLFLMMAAHGSLSLSEGRKRMAGPAGFQLSGRASL
jgi:uncharacterized membrane protein YuzA (DUF378 family)